jgi:membrane carboxypeptidase/penicillin-binding protein PbpC
MPKFYQKPKIFITAVIIVALLAVFNILSGRYGDKLIKIYSSRESAIIQDRNGQTMIIRPNPDGYYATYGNAIPVKFSRLLLAKEDKYFYYHFGLNPVSTARALLNFALGNRKLTSSTITQQLAKILLHQENQRNLKNKIKETFYALALETHLSKKEILMMYVNSIYFGNNVAGLEAAAKLYFDVSPEYLNDEQMLKLLATISHPTDNTPFDLNNTETAFKLGRRLDTAVSADLFKQDGDEKTQKLKFYQFTRSPNYFELENLYLYCQQSSRSTVDNDLSTKLRSILKRNLRLLANKDTGNGAIVVFSYPNNELIAMIGSPDPEVDAYGYKINMAVKPRAIGSTIKPFIYVKGFERNLRPYTLVDDREYKYTIGDGYAFYPKNYDYKYRGVVNLHYALSNSLNVPTVKVLEYFGIENFYNFLQKDLHFQPVQQIKNYELGIALGGMEMDLLTLSHYFSIFANQGILHPAKIFLRNDCPFNLPANFQLDQKIVADKYIQLVNSILSDRITGAEQFGQKSDLNLPYTNYGLKTGTSKDYRDSWTIGYTPDFLVGVWVGNSDNSSMNKVSGVAGAGKIWQESMNLLYSSVYNKKTPFVFNLLTEYADGKSSEYGLAGDNFALYKKLLADDRLILRPHDGDEYLREKDAKIMLTASSPAVWTVNGEILGSGKEKIFMPKKTGSYSIQARGENSTEKITIYVEDDN